MTLEDAKAKIGTLMEFYWVSYCAGDEGQMVCLLDEGDEVYEGDYINDFDDNFTMRVEWDDEEMRYVATEVYLTDEGWAANGDSYPLGAVVDMLPVGNIWDNEVNDFYEEDKE